MTQTEWLASEDPAAMLQYVGPLNNKISARKLRLFSCACWRLVHGSDDSLMRSVVEGGEALADGTDLPLDVPHSGSAGHFWPCASDAFAGAAAMAGADALARRKPEIAALLREIVGNPFRPVSLRGSCPNCKGDPCVCQNHWERRPLAQVCLWLTPTVLSLAQAGYDERERKCEACKGKKFKFASYDDGYYLGQREKVKCKTCDGTGTINDGTLDPFRLLVLRDSLLDAGCDCADLLTHLADTGAHVRGCWAVDLILGKS